MRDLRRGRQRWRTRRAAAQVQFPSKSSRTSLTVAGNLVYTLDTHLSALAASSGRIRWQRLAPPASRPGVLGADAAVVCALPDSLFAVYRARDGAALWQLDRRDGNGPFLGMALMGETIYVSSGVGARRDGFALEARDAVTGTLRPADGAWAGARPRGVRPGARPGAEGVPRTPGPLVALPSVAAACSMCPVRVASCAVRASDGAQLWQLHIGSALPALVAV